MIFEINGTTVEPTAEALLIPEFETLWEKDKTTTKVKARTYFAYIYHSVDPKSIYINSPNRELDVRNDFLDGKAPTADVTKAKDKYSKLVTTPEQRLLDGAMNAANKLADYLESVDLTTVDVKGQLVHKATDVMNMLKQLGTTMKSLKELRAIMEKGLEEKEANRGGAELNMFDILDDN